MLSMTFPQGLGEKDVRDIRLAVQGEAAQRGLAPQQGFVLLFVVDELCCNVMEHGRAAWAELKIEASAAGFRLTLVDNGVPFNAAQQAHHYSKMDLKNTGERRVGLNLVGRLVDELHYQRTEDGLNRVELAKTF